MRKSLFISFSILFVTLQFSCRYVYSSTAHELLQPALGAQFPVYSRRTLLHVPQPFFPSCQLPFRDGYATDTISITIAFSHLGGRSFFPTWGFHYRILSSVNGLGSQYPSIPFTASLDGICPVIRQRNGRTSINSRSGSRNLMVFGMNL